MREIKFRLIKDSKIVGYEKWYGGSFDKENNYMNYACWIAFPSWLYFEDNKKWTPDYIAHDSKEQFTGLKDYKGTIFDWWENDIIEDTYEKIGYVIQYDNLNASFLAKQIYRPDDKPLPAYTFGLCTLVSHGKKIGNIHDNPELVTDISKRSKDAK